MISREDSLIERLYECNRHKEKIAVAVLYLTPLIPFTSERFSTITDVESSYIDQMIFRFSKLQDTIGDKIFPLILYLQGENIKRMSVLDRLNRLEELELVAKDEWMTLREYRNDIAHEYSFNQDEVVESVNEIFQQIQELVKIYDSVYAYCVRQFDFVRNSEVLRDFQ
jgi:repressor of nif and glnA expression